MWCHIYSMIILTVCVPLVYSQAVVISTTKSDKFVCSKPFTLRCTVSGIACCTNFTRTWRKDTLQIMSNGVAISGKYDEAIYNAENYFDLITFNLDLGEDFDKEFVCSYGVYTSNPFKVVEDLYQCGPCWKCVKWCVPWIILGAAIGFCLNLLIYLVGIWCCPSCCYTRKCCCHKSNAARAGVYVIIFGTEYEKGKMKQRTILGIAVLLTILGFLLVHFVITALAGGTVCDACYNNQEAAFLSVGTGILIYSVIYHWTLNWRGEQKKEVDGSATVGTKGDGTFSTLRFVLYVVLTVFIVPIPFLYEYEWYRTGVDFSIQRLVLYVGLTVCVFPIPILFLYEYFRTGGNNRSTESGLLKKKRADKITEEKPVAVVRSQPPKARHVMTDNTESTKYSAENEKFSGGLDKGRTPRPLPSIGQPIDSQRPLPQMPPSTQQEKGGIQLQPLGDSTSEKKKKKRRKKKEIKNSDEED